jgi:tetratricopeptide (TPR) repeat protein
LLSERYDSSLTDVFEIEDELTKKVSERLRVVLFSIPAVPAVAAPTSNVDAHDLYLKGRYEWNRRSEDGLKRSVDHFSQAVARDPEYAPAHAGLADAYVTLSVYGALRPADAMPLALDAAERALAIDPKSAEAHTARSCVRAMYMWDWHGEEGFLQALELEPSNPVPHHWYATNYLMPLSRFGDARLHLNSALDLDPLSTAVRASVGLLLYFERRYDETAAQLLDTIARDPESGIARYFLALAFTELGRFDDALAELRKAKALVGQSPEMDGALGYALARAGRSEEARDVLGDLTRLSAERYVSPVLPAQIAAGLGDADDVFRYLEQAFELRATELAWLAVRPTFDGVHADPRFVDLCSRIFGR